MSIILIGFKYIFGYSYKDCSLKAWNDTLFIFICSIPRKILDMDASYMN